MKNNASKYIQALINLRTYSTAQRQITKQAVAVL
jgi:hypothetical protein